MKRILLLGLITIISVSCIGQSRFKKGISVGDPPSSMTQIDSIKTESGRVVFYESGVAISVWNDSIQTLADAIDILETAVLEDTTSLEEVARIFTDTIPLFVFGGGGANVGDTASFTTSTIYGSFYNGGSDTLVITEINVGIQGTVPIVEIDIMWNTTLSAGSATHLLTADFPINTTALGTSVFYTEDSFDEDKIPPGVRVWCKTPVLTARPTYMEVTMLGHIINGN